METQLTVEWFNNSLPFKWRRILSERYGCKEKALEWLNKVLEGFGTVEEKLEILENGKELRYNDEHGVVRSSFLKLNTEVQKGNYTAELKSALKFFALGYGQGYEHLDEDILGYSLATPEHRLLGDWNKFVSNFELDAELAHQLETKLIGYYELLALNY